MEIKSISQWNLKIKDGIIYNGERPFNVQELDDVDFSKPGIIIIDDNEGICSFIEDDLEELEDEGKLNLEDYNVFVFHGIMCAYDLMATIQKYPNMNIQKAIIDITYSGTVQTNNGNIKLNGVDVFEVLYELNPKLKYLFYTGNQMNNHIKVIGELMRKYSKLTGLKITDNILFKTQFSMNDRRNYIVKHLFKA
jgi:hypothetical protein